MCEASAKEEDSDSTECEDRFFVDPQILEMWRASWVQFKMRIKDNYLDLTLIMFQCPLSENIPRGVLELILSPNPSYTTRPREPMRLGLAGGTTSTMRNCWLWHHWFRVCSESHRKCRELDHGLQQILPDRLIEILTDDNGRSFKWKLVRRTNLGKISYLTLSHCWGSSQHVSLTKENYSAHMEPTESSKLPKSFQHAISVTFLLGFRFIWIDSLCIIQNDHKDWMAQASIMGSIYKNSSCNIAATWAADGDDGCFTTRNPRTITLDLGLGKSQEYHVDRMKLYYDDLMEAPWNKRGWVTQERSLARRQLSFAKSQVYWECRELVASEQYPTGIPQSLMDLSSYDQAAPPIGKPTLDYTTVADRRRAWAALVDFYSNFNFSKLSDKMIALAGLAKDMRNMTGDTYLAGLWKEDLQSQLCWSTDYNVRRRINRSIVPFYLAPTWSWASVNGPVISDPRYYAKHYKSTSFVEVLDVSIHSEHDSRLHSFVASSLVLREIAVWARALLPGSSVDRIDDDNWVLRFTGLKDSIQDFPLTDIPISIDWDENMSDMEVDPGRWPHYLEERNSDLLCMLVYGNAHDPVIKGLLLRRLPAAADEVVYVRMGVFSDYREILLDTMSARLGYSYDHSIIDGVDLDHVDLAGFVHTVTVI